MPTPRKAPDATKFTPIVNYKPAVIPLPNGNWEIRSGKPIISTDEEEIGTAEFAQATGLSQAYVARLCDHGLIKCRRMSPKEKSRYLIRSSEIQRYKTADPHEP